MKGPGFIGKRMMEGARRWSVAILMLCVFSVLSEGQSFNISQLSGETSTNPTQLAFGPDQRLYVLEVDGTLKIYTVSRTAPNTYLVTATETVSLIKEIQNHNDNGVVHTTVRRQATGMYVTGTATNPIVYVTSSDYRMGGGIISGTDTNLDTNSGVVSRLTKSGGSWSRLDLVRGLPRSEENHSTNGLLLDEDANVLYVAQGGNSNGGAPATAFAYLCEYALSAAVLLLDLNILDTMTAQTDTSSGAEFLYDLPTVDDPTRANANGISDPMDNDYNGVDIHDPFGGNDGLNQARLVENGPVQIYAAGFRNIYDLVKTELGFLYGWDNGPNPVWGGYPTNEGYGTANNDYTAGEPGSIQMNNIDCLHKIDTMGYYGGHPNPIRGNPDSAGLYTYGTSGYFRTEYLSGDPAHSLPYDWPPLPLSMADPVQGDFQIAGVENMFMDSIFKKSMNGICEYTASNFNGIMTGDLLTTGFVNGKLYRTNLDTLGNLIHPDSTTIIASSLLGMPLDVFAIGDSPPFPGSIWIVGHVSGGRIYVMEPADFFVCTGSDSYLIDEDSDGYTNADEYDNGTNPCNGADRPADHDLTEIGGFLVSNLNDPDDDDDGLPDSTDYFVWDPANGLTTAIPLEYPLLNSDPGEGFYGLGFTGFMSNGSDDYLALWRNENNSSTSIIAGGAAGLLTIAPVDTGDALSALNGQHNGFQFGVAVDSLTQAFIFDGGIRGPVFPDTAQDFQSVGIYLGTGSQSDYVRIAVNADGGDAGIEIVVENGDTPTVMQYQVADVGSANGVHLALIVNPENGYVRAQYALDTNSLVDLDDGFYLTGNLLNALRGPDALALGVSATARGSDSAFIATWDHLSVRFMPETRGEWVTLHGGTGCQSSGSGPCPYGRHEAAYVQSGDKFYLLGGREQNSNVNIFNPLTNIWSVGANPPDNSLHHFQAVDYYGLILSAGAFKGGAFPEERVDSFMRVYNPVTNTWHVGPKIPLSRRRGSAGATIRNDTLFMLGGLTNGHLGGSVQWMDAFDFVDNAWNILPDAPHKRDHFHLVHNDTLLVAAAGRRTSLLGGFDSLFLSTEPKVDVYNSITDSWDVVAATIPTQRAANTAVVLGDEVIVIGGERESGPSKYATEALNIHSGTWRTLDSLNVPRNGIQAILNNGGIYVASGARERAGSMLTRSTEAFYFYGQTDPILVPTDASDLVAADQDFGMVAIMDTATADLYLHNSTGNQAILLKKLTMFDSTAFTLDTLLSFPRFLKPGDSLRIPLMFGPTAIQAYTDTIYVTHTGANAPVKKIVLSGDGIFTWLGATRAYVDTSATGTGFGTSWSDAFTELREALNVAESFPLITEVWIAQGTYKPDESRTAAFVLRDSLIIYGGFNGTETLVSQRDIGAYPVILSGDIGVVLDSSDNVYHVLVMSDTTEAAIVDGVTISSGLADGTLLIDQHGAGVFNTGKLVLRNCIIRNCNSDGTGSALVNSGISAYLILEEVKFHNNSDPHLLNSDNGTLIFQGPNNTFEEE